MYVSQVSACALWSSNQKFYKHTQDVSISKHGPSLSQLRRKPSPFNNETVTYSCRKYRIKCNIILGVHGTIHVFVWSRAVVRLSDGFNHWLPFSSAARARISSRDWNPRIIININDLSSHILEEWKSSPRRGEGYYHAAGRRGQGLPWTLQADRPPPWWNKERYWNPVSLRGRSFAKKLVSFLL